jgi:hypothetical protein
LAFHFKKVILMTIDFSSSSGVAGDESTGDLSAVTPVRVKRRKKRKRQTPILGLDEDDEDTTKKVT